MHSSKLLRHLITTSLLASATWLVQAQTFNVQELGDDELSCQALYDGTKDMDALIRRASQSPSQQQAQRQSGNSTGGVSGDMARESGSSEGARVANLFGRLIASAGGGVAAQPSVDPAVQREQAQARKQHLSNLFRSKKCKVSSLRK